ncbi:hypothetical protein SAMN03159341_11885 [Paenibacillus sp. 1_12]|uniref:hypothetical protein n=1 Tax=Paenibacillus sp. 1_12 TaxID=1566278 RepID=UPI0008E55A0F|nr:hypothetical protein [Paenibacillus sp. 1_12]SFM15635.1 hypothetical protein SAMN03159341_11885 [Paenibacillus sp. 1_12]
MLSTTTKNAQRYGQSLKRYLICPDCGCEYAIDSNKKLLERTYFIKGFEVLSNFNIANLTWPERERVFGLKRNRILRIIAYFSSRGKNADIAKYTEKDIDETKIDKIIENIKAGTKIYEIQHWECWGNDEYYLLHRYHSRVILAYIANNYSISPTIEQDKDLAGIIENVCSELLESDGDITLTTVSMKIGCSATTIRCKGCSSIINRYREQQQMKRRHSLILRIKHSVNEFFNRHKDEMIYLKNLFENLEVCRETIRRISPDLCKQIDRRREEWNQRIK